MNSVIAFLSRPLTPSSSIQVTPLPKSIRQPELREDTSGRVINHVHCVSCRGKMLPTLDRTYYCMGCKCATNNRVSLKGQNFITQMLMGSRAHEMFGPVTDYLTQVNRHA